VFFTNERKNAGKKKKGEGSCTRPLHSPKGRGTQFFSLTEGEEGRIPYHFLTDFQFFLEGKGRGRENASGGEREGKGTACARSKRGKSLIFLLGGKREERGLVIKVRPGL